jgi:hypothetical protein
MTTDREEFEVPDAYGYTIFCDDIRHEIDGKISFIGCYTGVLNIHSNFPAKLPKFCFSVFLNQKHETFVPNCTISVRFPGENEKLEMEVAEPAEGHILRSVNEAEPVPLPRILMQVVLIASPLELKEPGEIAVTASLKGKIVRLGRIMVRAVPPPTNSAT